MRPGEPFDAAMRRFRRKVTNAGVINEVKRRRTFENSQDIKKRKEKERHLKNKRRCGALRPSLCAVSEAQHVLVRRLFRPA